jgi:hypothetical protein
MLMSGHIVKTWNTNPGRQKNGGQKNEDPTRVDRDVASPPLFCILGLAWFATPILKICPDIRAGRPECTTVASVAA